MINLNTLLANAPTPLSSPSVQSDPLIDQGGQLTVYIGSALIILGVAAIVGFFSRRIEHAVVAALALSLFLVGFWIFTR